MRTPREEIGFKERERDENNDPERKVSHKVKGRAFHKEGPMMAKDRV